MPDLSEHYSHYCGLCVDAGIGKLTKLSPRRRYRPTIKRKRSLTKSGTLLRALNVTPTAARKLLNRFSIAMGRLQSWKRKTVGRSLFKGLGVRKLGRLLGPHSEAT